MFTILFNLSVTFFFSMYLFVRFGINKNQIVQIIVAAFGFWPYVINHQVSYFEFLFGYWVYPDSQKYISELIEMFVHAGNRAIITTHSPYILGEFNNLLYVNEIQGVDEQRNEIVDEEKILPYYNSRVFYVADGLVKDAMEDHLIINSLIDGTSDEINTENDRRKAVKQESARILFATIRLFIGRKDMGHLKTVLLWLI